MSPTVSIIMPCYNAAAHLPHCIGSVLAQTRAEWELIAVDDGSTDGTWQELQRLAAADPRQLHTAFLDADDTRDREFLKAMSAALDDLPAARKIFRAVMQHGYGTLKDWTHMLPAWLPGILVPQAAPAAGLALTTDTTQRWTTLTPPPEPACHHAPTENAPR